MDIEKISLGKISRSKRKTETETNKKPEIVETEGLTKEEKTALEKIRNKAWIAYAAALMGASTAMTSCVNQDQSTVVDFNMDEFKKMFQQLIDLQQQILEQIKANGDQNSQENQQIIEQLKKINEELNNIFNGIVDIKEGIVNITNLIKEANSNDDEFLAKIDEIINNQNSDSEKLQQILEENQKQNAWLANIAPYIESIANLSQETANTLKEFYEAYKQGEITHSEFMQKLLDAVKENNSISSDILAKIDDLQNAMESGNITEAELLQKIADLLASIDNKMSEVIDKLNEINGNILNISDKMDKNHQETIEKLENIGTTIQNGFEINQGQMDELIQLNKEGNNNTTQLLVEMENLKNILNQIKENDGDLAIQELIIKYGDLMGEKFDAVIDKLGNGVKIENIDDIINAINNAKPDLSKIQEQMGTIIVLLQRAQTSGITSADLQPIVEGLKNLQESNEQGTAAVNTNLAQILADLAEIKGMLPVLVETTGEILDAVNKYGTASQVSFETLANGMTNLINGQVKPDQVNTMYETLLANMNQAQASRNQTVTLLQAILDNQGKGESGMTQEELADVINNSTILGDIKDLLSDLNVDRVTNETLNQAITTNKTDLSKIQEQLGTVIVLLQRTQSGNVTVDTSKLEASIYELVDVVTNQGVTSNTAMKDISDKLQALIDKLNEEVPSEPSEQMVRLAKNSDTIFYEAYAKLYGNNDTFRA